MIKKIDGRLGEVYVSNSNISMKIIEYKGCDDITIEFEDGYKVKSTYRNFKRGEIKNPYAISVYNIGYLGECKTDRFSYEFWHGMLKRCYSQNESDLIKYSAYKDCSVCKEWYNYSNFKEWFDINYYNIGDERIELDKDILIKGNKIYRPEACIFVPQRINKLFIKGNLKRGSSMIGMWKTYNNKFICQIDNKTYDKEIDAFNVYKQAKEKHIQQIADEYKEKYHNFPQKLYDALYSYQVERTD